LTRWERIRHPQEHSLYLGRAHHRRTLRVSVQEHGAIIGPPRSYKSALLSRLIMAAPGAVVSTSTKPDMFTLTSGLRARRGPVYVFNPQGIGGIPSTVRWSPLEGCLEPATAIRRADAFAQAVSTAGAEDGAFWAGKASDAMRAMFAAAAYAATDMRTVNRWATGRRVTDAVTILSRAGQGEWAGQLAELTGPAEKTAATVKMVVSRALGWLNDPQLAQAVLPGPGQGFDITEFLLGGGTLYMIAKGDGEDCSLAPLFAALACEIEYQATRLGAQMPGQRLDPPLLMALDEVTQICPVPLPQWLADAGGQGVQIWSAFHGLSQLEARWQAAGAQAVMDTSNVKVLMPGLDDTRTLERARRLAGQAAFREHGEERHSRHDVLTEDMIRMLPVGWALLLRGNHRPVIARLAKGWRDREYRRAKRAGTAVAQLTPLTATHALLRVLHDDQQDIPAELDDAAAVTEAAEPVSWLRPLATNGDGPAANGSETRQSYPWDGGDAA
jgi:type IV secretory pathway TraG/TraD family ATPase VirD4